MSYFSKHAKLQSAYEELAQTRLAVETERRRYQKLLALEQAAHAQAERDRERLAFLAEVSEILASSLDCADTLGRLARHSVPRVADFCTVFESGPGGALHQLAHAHADPEREPLLARIGQLYRVLPDNPGSLIARVARTGRAEIVQEPARASRASTADPEVWGIVAQLGPRSAMILPLAVRGRTLGILSFIAAESGRIYGEEDLALAQEIARRAASALENARLFHEVRAANDAKDRFLATLSHELRTPLTPVVTLTQGIEEDPRLPDDVRRQLAIVRRNVELEARLIDDLLDLTRISRGKLEMRTAIADMRSIFEHTLATAAPEIEARGLQLVTDLSAREQWVRADASRLTQVFWNLLQNAAKFTPAGGTVTVRSRIEEEPVLTVTVADTGRGIEPELLPRIFDAFEQGSSVTRRFGGLGLGLAISKTIVELHGGELTAASEGAGRGAVFTVRLPLAEAAETAAEPMAPQPSRLEALPASEAGPRLHVLLVEDHADSAEAMAELLRTLGYSVTVAGTVADALAAASAAQRNGAIDFVVSDLGLPDGSGLDLMRELIRRYGLRGIALSGYGMEEDVRRSLEAGFDRHLTKPVNPHALREVLAETAKATVASIAGGP